MNVIGWAAAPTGVGEACRGTLSALEHAKVPTALWNLGAGAADDPRQGGTQGLPFDVLLFHVNADMMPIVSRQLPPRTAHRPLPDRLLVLGARPFPPSHSPSPSATSMRSGAPTRFCLDAYKAAAPVDVRWMPPCVLPPAQEPADRQALGVPAESFLFYFAFDALSIPERKNPRRPAARLRPGGARQPHAPSTCCSRSTTWMWTPRSAGISCAGPPISRSPC